ncbi:MAG: putative phosphatase [Myxococcota bacterium]|nr:putative phosphatase [Myxococcota bacterium]
MSPSSPKGRQIAAFFDLDHTLVRKNTGELFAKYVFKKGRASFWDMTRGLIWVAQNKFNVIDMDAMSERILSQMKGQEEEDTIRFCERWFEEVVKKYISTRAQQRVEDHKVQGHRVVVLSASTPYVVIPLVRYLKMDDFICTTVQVEQGKFTGVYNRPLCYGPGKVHWAKIWAEKHNVDLDACYFYTDSYSDLPMLKAVGFPRVVNPDPQLNSYAKQAGWPVEMFV